MSKIGFKVDGLKARVISLGQTKTRYGRGGCQETGRLIEVGDVVTLRERIGDSLLYECQDESTYVEGVWHRHRQSIHVLDVEPIEEVPAHVGRVAEPEALPDFVASTGAVRSSDGDDLDFCSLPLVGLFLAMKNAGCGGIKYGRYNYAKGFPIHKTINHAVVHVMRWLNGDRSEAHLCKAAWGFLLAAQTEALQPEQVAPHVLGPGATLSAELLAEMAKGEEERSAKRRSKAFEALFHWQGKDIPEVAEVVAARQAQADA